ncbi:hypothetical protein [Jannaschia sp. W003]|uniref:hypothetical protein n=1 Tax=Jannaschia sp. W003 TaxID=2867012 RepID=UPI0021A3B54A|nr:hypothetical protein [Jannaschia sp. W003]UWQ20136.1 hypothetical protein K3554_08965 [Jannaschia sp. W003]
MHTRWTTAAVLGLAGVAGPASAQENDPQSRLETLVSHFAAGAVVGEPSIVDCTLSDGTETSCFAITVMGAPEDHATGPWCPTNVAQDGPDAGGIWLENDRVYEVDGPFIANFDAYYDDPV